MKTFSILVLFFASWSFLCQVDSSIADSTSNDADDIVDIIDKFVKSVLDCAHPPSLSLAVVKDGKVVRSKGYGHTTADRSQRTTSKTKFAIGSLTKAFTSLLIAKTVRESHNITFDTPISEYIDNFRLVDDYRSKYATLRDLLSHRVAVPDNPLPFYIGFDPKLTRKEFVRRLQFMETPHSFREKWIYSNSMYILAGDILERLNGGRPWEDLVQDNIFTPLGMVDSGFITRVSNYSSFALPCDVRDGTVIDLSPETLTANHVAGGAGAIYTTADDMAKWMNFWLSGDISGFEQAMKEATFEPGMAFFGINWNKPSSSVSYNAHYYCMGWFKAVYREYKQIFHSGSIATYNSLVWLYPDLKIGIYMSVNGPQENRMDLLKSIHYYISDVLIGLPPWLDPTEVCYNAYRPVKRTARHCKSRSNLDLTPYFGNYSRADVGAVSITLNSSSNQLHLNYGYYGGLELCIISKGVFQGIYTGAASFYNYHPEMDLTIKFSFDKSNQVSSFLIVQIGSMGRFHKDN